MKTATVWRGNNGVYAGDGGDRGGFEDNGGDEDDLRVYECSYTDGGRL